MNTLHLYGNIADVFEGKIIPSALAKKDAGVSPELSFGLGVSCFQDDLSNIGDAVYFDQQFFIRSTDEGQNRDPYQRKFKEGQVQDYRTVYSLGVTNHPLKMQQRKFLYEETCKPGFTVEDLISRVIGPPQLHEAQPRSFGFLGLLDYETNYSTSLSVPPIHGENIIPLMSKYARESHPLKEMSGLVMGFVRDRASPQNDEKTITLSRRLFFDNPKDRTSSQEFLAGPYWISHTHGVRLKSGKSAFPSESKLFEKMSADDSFCTSVIGRALDRKDLDDCGHVIPRSTLRRYFLIAFPIHAIEAFN